MAFNVNSVPVKKVLYGGNQVKQVLVNGVRVWNSDARGSLCIGHNWYTNDAFDNITITPESFWSYSYDRLRFVLLNDKKTLVYFPTTSYSGYSKTTDDLGAKSSYGNHASYSGVYYGIDINPNNNDLCVTYNNSDGDVFGYFRNNGRYACPKYSLGFDGFKPFSGYETTAFYYHNGYIYVLGRNYSSSFCFYFPVNADENGKTYSGGDLNNFSYIRLSALDGDSSIPQTAIRHNSDIYMYSSGYIHKFSMDTRTLTSTAVNITRDAGSWGSNWFIFKDKLIVIYDGAVNGYNARYVPLSNLSSVTAFNVPMSVYSRFTVATTSEYCFCTDAANKAYKSSDGINWTDTGKTVNIGSTSRVYPRIATFYNYGSYNCCDDLH